MEEPVSMAVDHESQDARVDVEIVFGFFDAYGSIRGGMVGGGLPGHRHYIARVVRKVVGRGPG